ncbi:hypothetical protein [Streptomyces litchfieldiae]|uniref:Integral membrane protein n=1 Tax=Streptomyces litchfieldiae TaxID=3075543 RepID=A0ABU2MUS4_9ACTN|nr:hypothetical protein [Streptomyces sp. DSM 44938]MDT0345397.1 hypothetical protein [Streptomyces sp. DSM 44938]
MRAGPMVRAARTSVFAALCVLLSALGHQMMSGHPVPWPTLAAGLAATAVGAWAVARRERGPGAVITGTLIAQGLLHTAFSRTGAHGPASGAMSAREWAVLLLCGPPDNGSMSEGEAVELLHHAGVGHLAAAPSHGGEQPVGMIAAHVLAAVLSALWLWGGERAIFRLLRATTRRLLAPMPWLFPPGPVQAPAARSIRFADSARVPRLLLLVRVVPSRGPPVVPAVR